MHFLIHPYARNFQAEWFRFAGNPVLDLDSSLEWIEHTSGYRPPHPTYYAIIATVHEYRDELQANLDMEFKDHEELVHNLEADVQGHYEELTYQVNSAEHGDAIDEAVATMGMGPSGPQ